jgi:hypothetical protein
VGGSDERRDSTGIANRGSARRRTRSCPNSGRYLIQCPKVGTVVPVNSADGDRDLVRRVVASTGLSAADAARVVDDVVAYFAEPVDAYVRRRHAALQARGLTNPAIFPVIRAELDRRVVAPPELSDRQLRRIVYG